ncbi:MAG: rRNA maturation RNase YbeY [Bacteroidia bacterium]
MVNQSKKKETLQLLDNYILDINYLDRKTNQINKQTIKNLIHNIVSRETKDFKIISINFCSDDKLLKINNKYLNHDYLTDIITFQLNDANEEIITDIYISLDRARENSKLLNIKYKNEIYRLIIHGLLHCCGYKDRTNKEKRKMREKENEYLNLLL